MWTTARRWRSRSSSKAPWDDDTACIVSGLTGDVAKVLHSLLVFRRVPVENVVDSLGEAKRLSKHLLATRRLDVTNPDTRSDGRRS